MDVDEYLNILMERLEAQLEDKEILKEHFQGVMTHEIRSKDCQHSSKKEELFLAVSLSMKHKKTLHQALQELVKGDLLEGENAYFCEACDAKVNALKRITLKKLPKHLIFVLKRFEYDYDRMQRVKINDYCEFPSEVNM